MRFGRRAGLWSACALLALLGAMHAVVTPLVPLQRLEWLTDDLRTRAAASSQAGPHPDIVIVDIDEASLRDLGRWPWPRDRLAALTRELFERQGVAAVGFDLLFGEPDVGDLSTLRALAAEDPVVQARLPQWQQALNHDRGFALALAGRPAVLGWYLTADRGGTRAGTPPQAVAQVPHAAPTPGLLGWNGYAANVPALAQAVPRAGFFNALPDADGVVRSVAIVARLGDELHESLALALWRLATGSAAPQVDWRAAGRGPSGALALAGLRYRRGEPAAAPSGRAGAEPPGQRWLNVDERGALRVPFRGLGGPLGGSFRYVSAADLLAGRWPASALSGQIALIGSSAPGLADLRATPIHTALPGVEIHAHMLAGLLDDNLPQRPDWAPGYEAVLIALTLVVATASALWLSAPGAMAGFALWLMALAAGTAWAERMDQLVLPVASALALGGLQFVLATSVNTLRDWRRRRVLVDLFSSYLPPTRVRQLLRDSELSRVTAAENRELTVLFCDLQGFSHLAEKLPPQALRELLNHYFSDASAIIQAHDGTLDKFIGDAVMAFWGAPLPQPDHALRAVRAALALAEGAVGLNDRLCQLGLPPVRYGIGLATGLVCVGDLGSKLRRSYTAVGDAVNLAARLEALTREFGLDLLVADSTRLACGDRLTELDWLEVDEVRVRGRNQPVTLFTPLTCSNAARPTAQAESRIWHLALAAARQHHSVPALAHLAELDGWLARHPSDSPAALASLTERLSQRLQARPVEAGGNA